MTKLEQALEICLRNEDDFTRSIHNQHEQCGDDICIDAGGAVITEDDASDALVFPEEHEDIIMDFVTIELGFT